MTTTVLASARTPTAVKDVGNSMNTLQKTLKNFSELKKIFTKWKKEYKSQQLHFKKHIKASSLVLF
jgi:hypothetical protein